MGRETQALTIILYIITAHGYCVGLLPFDGRKVENSREFFIFFCVGGEVSPQRGYRRQGHKPLVCDTPRPPLPSPSLAQAFLLCFSFPLQTDTSGFIQHPENSPKWFKMEHMPGPDTQYVPPKNTGNRSTYTSRAGLITS